MLKKTFRKALVPAALAAVLLTTGCTGGMTTPANPITPSATASESATVSPSAEATQVTPEATVTPDVVASSAAPAASSETSAIIADAKQKITSITVKGRAPKTGYSRDEFGPAWSDVDHNGCDTRNDILARDLTDETFKAGTKNCVVETGVLQDKYTGKTINFVRGQKTSTLVQIDHIVALSDAYQTGAQQLSPEQRKQLSNDPMNLMAADGPANGSKSDSNAASWLPSNTSFRCEYVAKQTLVKSKYNLWMIEAEKAKISEVLAGC